MKVAVVLACVAVVGVNLYGCGGGGDSGDTTTQPSKGPTTSKDSGGTTAVTTAASTAPTTTTSTTPPKPLPPRDGQEVADLMNSEYYGYEPGDKTSPFGNYIRVTGDVVDWVHCGGKCWEGGPDCRVSGSIFNSYQMYDPSTHNRVGGWYGYQNGQGMAGFYVNSSLIRTKLGKCTYAWDGASMGKVNGACGCLQGPTGPGACNVPEAAYFNKVPPEYTETSNAESINVKPCWCDVYTGGDGKPVDGTGNQCYWKGAAFDTTKGEDSEDQTNTMMDWRVGHTRNGSGSHYGAAVLVWNEMVLDGARVQEALRMDPTGTIVAVVYTGQDQWSQGIKRPIAQKMARDMQSKFKLSAPIPVIQLDQSVDTQSGAKTPVWLYNEKDQPKSVTAV